MNVDVLCSGSGPGRRVHGGSPRLHARLRHYAGRYSWAGMGRLQRALRQPGDGGGGIQRPGLLHLPELPSCPYYARDGQPHDLELLERHYLPILAEFERARREPSGRGGGGWVCPPAGGWVTFPLYAAGSARLPNCRACPRTSRALRALRNFISSNSLGDAGFYLLRPGTLLGPSYGLTNARLRCHLGLKVPTGCELVVGGEPQCWSEGHCLLLDDSFLHTTAHN
ncbi:LOW QUALITY PROTEIN: aspartate beta-hydroxylase domain-containing protein 1-like, partial [Heterodontus francisci]|uniref:LOW QUALITY PROTEIN: aspartate beta-hydroxylase domain-containing protein 1-like n=1 Tax=Heterodontus francisci TaxID=7792 RepID=UPI00355AD60F